MTGPESARRRPGRPATGTNPTRSLRIGPIWDEAVAAAKERGGTITRVVEAALVDFVAHPEPEGGPPVIFDPPFEYQSGTCDVWQVAHFVNYMAEYGWEPIAVADGHYDGVKVYKDFRDEQGSDLVPALKAMVVLFRRPSGWGAAEDES